MVLPVAGGEVSDTAKEEDAATVSSAAAVSPPSSSRSGKLQEWWRLLEQLFRSVKWEAIPANPDVAVPPATDAEPFCCWALAITPRCARAIKMVKDDSAETTWGVRFHIYKMMSFVKEDEPNLDYLELARFLLYLDGHANCIKLKASAEPNDQPFRDWAEEKALLRSIAGFVPGECLHRTSDHALCIAFAAAASFFVDVVVGCRNRFGRRRGMVGHIRWRRAVRVEVGGGILGRATVQRVSSAEWSFAVQFRREMRGRFRPQYSAMMMSMRQADELCACMYVYVGVLTTVVEEGVTVKVSDGVEAHMTGQ